MEAKAKPLTPALRRALEKAATKGCVRRAGIYADNPEYEVADQAEFDRQQAIDRAIVAGLLTAGTAYNTYVLTAAGAAAVEASAS